MRYASKALAAALAAGAVAAAAQTPVYRCIDAQGRRLTSDRPIPECTDRTQQVVHASGVVRTVAPSLSDVEAAHQHALKRTVELDHAAQRETVRRDRALRARYPSPASFEQQRQATLGPLQDRVEFTQRALKAVLARHELALSRQTRPVITPSAELEFTSQQLRYQQNMLRAYEEELRALTAQFDQQLARLRVLWAEDPATAAAAAAATTQLR
jgi:Rad3-related DNA helicase